MRPIRIATAQFEHKSRDKAYNLDKIDRLAGEANVQGCDIISFHECCIPGYSFARKTTKKELFEVAEYVPEGPSTEQLARLANKHRVAIMAGLFERDSNGYIYNSYLCVDKDGLVAKSRKLHPFISPYLSAGNQLVVFDYLGWKCGILVCYDNNIIENVRAISLLGAEIIFMPHVTMCTPSTRPGAGFVDPGLWHNRKADPTSLRLEFDGMKGRSWLIKWLPARAYDNGVYVVFSNPIGMDDDQLKNGCSMIIDPFGDILVECRKLGDDVIVAECNREKLEKSGGARYRKARRPDLYKDILGQTHQAEQKVSWLD
jgi:predicted amidohydrolase